MPGSREVADVTTRPKIEVVSTLRKLEFGVLVLPARTPVSSAATFVAEPERGATQVWLGLGKVHRPRLLSHAAG